MAHVVDFVRSGASARVRTTSVGSSGAGIDVQYSGLLIILYLFARGLIKISLISLFARAYQVIQPEVRSSFVPIFSTHIDISYFVELLGVLYDLCFLQN